VDTRQDSRQVWVLASVVAIVGMLGSGCDSRMDFPLIRYDVRLEEAAQGGSCDDVVDVAFDPIQIAPQVEGNLYQMSAFTYPVANSAKPVEDGPGNHECWYDYLSPALSPGKWKISGEFDDGSRSCLRDVNEKAPAAVIIDQEDGCMDLAPHR
jgi:hypothetical protein